MRPVTGAQPGDISVTIWQNCAVASSAGNICSMRKSCTSISSGVPKVMMVENMLSACSPNCRSVVSIGADDGDLVREGQVLVQFDPNDAEVALQSAEANLGKVVRQVRGLYSNVDGIKAQLAAQRAEVQKAQDNYNRRRNLAAGGAISQEELSHAKDDLTSAQNALNNIQQQLVTSSALVDDTQVSSHPDVKAAAAQLRQAYLNSARSTLIAPVTGYVAKRTVQLGQRVQPGTALMAVIPLDQLWIDANFKETQLGKMRIGQPVDIEADLYGGDVKFSGTVDSVGAGTGSAFALLPAQNATVKSVLTVQFWSPVFSDRANEWWPVTTAWCPIPTLLTPWSCTVYIYVQCT